nr:MAG TPA: hypothetical protein [Caudoviricetes sp.]
MQKDILKPNAGIQTWMIWLQLIGMYMAKKD